MTKNVNQTAYQDLPNTFLSKIPSRSVYESENLVASVFPITHRCLPTNTTKQKIPTRESAATTVPIQSKSVK